MYVYVTIRHVIITLSKTTGMQDYMFRHVMRKEQRTKVPETI